jgi:hypothetical protein
MAFPNNHPNPTLRGQAKGLEIVLKEGGLWLGNGRRTDGFRFLSVSYKPRQMIQRSEANAV